MRWERGVTTPRPRSTILHGWPSKCYSHRLVQTIPLSLRPPLSEHSAAIGQVVEHLFTVDLEEYFQVSAFEGIAPRDRWDSFPSRVERNVDELLQLLARHDAAATFFTLGWIADRHPALVKRIAGAGHEIASHGWWHRRVTSLSRDEFRTDVRDARRILEDVAGQPVVGYRAPSFSMVPGTEWAFDVLIEEGYRFDSSLFPIRRPGYGYPGADPYRHTLARAGGVLVELPLATTSWLGVRLPAAGGGWFRQLPYALTRRAFREHSDRGVPAVFYVHPWEIDPAQPKLATSALTRVRHYRGLDRTMPRLERLLGEFRFTSVQRSLDREGTSADRGAHAAGVRVAG